MLPHRGQRNKLDNGEDCATADKGCGGGAVPRRAATGVAAQGDNGDGCGCVDSATYWTRDSRQRCCRLLDVLGGVEAQQSRRPLEKAQ